MNLASAFKESCNVFYGELGRRIGREPYLQFLDSIGFEEPLNLNRIKVRPMKASVPENDESLLSWFAVGQPVGEIKLQVHPLGLAAYAGAIANGVLMEPQIIDAFIDPLGREIDKLKPTVKREAFNPETAATLHQLMAKTASDYGVWVDGMDIGLKTGTGEVEGQEGYVSLVTSHSYNESFPYAVCVILDEAWGGFESVTPIIQQIYQALAYLKP